MKMVFTPYVDELSQKENELRDRVINIMIMYNIPVTVIAQECKLSLFCMHTFLKKDSKRKATLISRRKIAAWVQEFEQNEKEL